MKKNAGIRRDDKVIKHKKKQDKGKARKPPTTAPAQMAADVRLLQRTLGNEAVGKMIASQKQSEKQEMAEQPLAADIRRIMNRSPQQKAKGKTSEQIQRVLKGGQPPVVSSGGQAPSLPTLNAPQTARNTSGQNPSRRSGGGLPLGSLANLSTLGAGFKPHPPPRDRRQHAPAPPNSSQPSNPSTRPTQLGGKGKQVQQGKLPAMSQQQQLLSPTTTTTSTASSSAQAPPLPARALSPVDTGASSSGAPTVATQAPGLPPAAPAQIDENLPYAAPNYDSEEEERLAYQQQQRAKAEGIDPQTRPGTSAENHIDWLPEYPHTRDLSHPDDPQLMPPLFQDPRAIEGRVANPPTLSSMQVPQPPPPEQGFIDGLGQSEFAKMFTGQRKRRLDTKIAEIKADGAKPNASWTALNEQLIGFMVDELSAYRQVIKNKGDQAGSTQKKHLKSLDSLVNLQSDRPEEAKKGDPAKAHETLGMSETNIEAMKKVAEMRGETLYIRSVGNNPEASALAVGHQDAGLPTKPYSIKMKSETTTGLVPADQFYEHGFAPSSKGRGAKGANMLGIIEQMINFGVPVSNQQQKINKAYPEARADGEEAIKVADNAIEGIKARKRLASIDNHILMSKTDILAGIADENQHKWLEEILKNEDDEKRYVVSASKKLPIIGDYDVYQVISKKIRLGTEPLQDRTAVGGTSAGYLSGAVDHNIGAALSGYKGGLLIHHGAEMDNTKMPQGAGEVLKVSKEGHQVIAPDGHEFKNLLEDTMQAIADGKGSTRYARPFHEQSIKQAL